MKTKAYGSFKSKLDYFNDDLDFMDIVFSSVHNKSLSDKDSPYIFKNLDPNKHISLARRGNKPTSRRLVTNHFKATVYAAYVKDIYEELTHYLRTILKDASISCFDSNRIAAKNSKSEGGITVPIGDILRQGSWEKVCEHISNLIFQSLEREQSTISLLKKIASKLNLNIPDSVIDDVLPYLEIRHFLVHSDGRVDDKFKAKYPHIKLDQKDFVILSFSFIAEFRTKVHTLILAYESEAIRTNLLDSKFLSR